MEELVHPDPERGMPATSVQEVSTMWFHSQQRPEHLQVLGAQRRSDLGDERASRRRPGRTPAPRMAQVDPSRTQLTEKRRPPIYPQRPK
nr:unnamed protein product [Rangifer tarandus platyrhynchus]